MVIFGAIDFSAEMAKLASEVGYRVTICDARGPFVNSTRFSQAAEVVVDWPDRYLEGQDLGARDVVLIFTHDPKFDEPALISTLATGAGYVGALGSRRTQARRVERLREAGLDEPAIEQDPRALRARRGRPHTGRDGGVDSRRAAHSSERIAAPVSCWIGGRTGASLAELQAAAARVGGDSAPTMRADKRGRRVASRV